MKKIVFYSFVALGVLGIAIASASYAHNSESGLKSIKDGPLSEEILQAKADYFGLSVEELNVKLDEGQTLKEIFKEQGITKEDYYKQMKAKKEAWISKIMEEGFITQEQIDAKMQHKQEYMQNHDHKGWMGHGKGMMK